jgi:lipopolysaccharide/colanic/teichoic acid biosynthesis glycosyltransferase
MLSKNELFFKRSFDIAFSLAGLIFLFPIIISAWMIACIVTKKNGFFIQDRVGQEGAIFRVIKIRTMKIDESISTTVTQKADPRITAIGIFFRKTKVDELPQLWNVLKGDMSFVGPRPDVVGYADKLKGEDRKILSIRPGITGPAQLAYKNEENILALHKNPIKYNDEIIWPHKIRINLDYVSNYSFKNDIYLIMKTIIGRNE